MNAKASSVILASVLALVGSPARMLAADPAPPASVEAADRQFLAALENGAPEPVASGAPDTTTPPVSPVKKHVAPKSSAAPVVKKEAASAKVAGTGPKKSAPSVKREASRASELVEVRKAIPVTVTTTTTYAPSVDRDDDDDHDRDHDEDDDHDHDRHDGFFDRLFRGEKIFR